MAFQRWKSSSKACYDYYHRTSVTLSRYGNNGIFLLREYLGMDDAKKGSIVRMNFLVSTMTAFEEVEDEEC